MTTYSFHAKRVTLQLAKLSTVADSNLELQKVLQELPKINWNFNQLDQLSQEIIFDEFDEDFEATIKAEFVADPTFLIDLGVATGDCPLCGHVGCRYIFRITNIKNQKTIECGSECILSHGLSVKGSETAEHARKALEKTIRQHIRKLKILAWHEESGFNKILFLTVNGVLESIQSDYSLAQGIRSSAYWQRRRSLRKLNKFYDRHGWLNTEKKWAEWSRIVKFARMHNSHGSKVLASPKPFGNKAGKEVSLPATGPSVEPKGLVEPEKVTNWGQPIIKLDSEIDLHEDKNTIAYSMISIALGLGEQNGET